MWFPASASGVYPDDFYRGAFLEENKSAGKLKLREK
jgi:hypothetical protein